MKKKQAKNGIRIRTADNKGRVVLGAPFANLPVSVTETVPGAEWKIQLVEVRPMSKKKIAALIEQRNKAG